MRCDGAEKERKGAVFARKRLDTTRIASQANGGELGAELFFAFVRDFGLILGPFKMGRLVGVVLLSIM